VNADRPTREQVDADLARVADPDTCTDGLHRRLAAEVLDLRTELEAARVASEQIAEWRSAEQAELERLRSDDDLARDVARQWATNTCTCGGPGGIELGARLDRLTAALLPAEPCCDCMCGHNHTPDPTLAHIGGARCVACKWCSCPHPYPQNEDGVNAK
jgi:hypothetical protein